MANQGWYTVCLQSSQYKVILLSVAPSISFLQYLPLSRQRGAQLAEAPPFLVSKQVILFSIPVPTEMAIICPLKRSRTLQRNTGNACQRNCWSWFGRENYKWPFTTNTEPPAAAHFSTAHSFCFFRNVRSIIFKLDWKHIVIRKARL